MNSIAIDARDVNWRWLFRIGGLASLMSVVVLRVQTLMFIFAPSPDSFINFSQSVHLPLVAILMFMDLLIIFDWLLHLPLFISLYIVLRRTDERYMFIALQTILVASVVHFAADTAIDLVTLNGSFFAAGSNWDQVVILSYATGMMRINDSAPSYISYMLTALGGLMFAIVMLRSHLFGNTMSYFGIIGNLLALGIFIPVIGIWCSALVATFVGLWYLMIGWRLLWFSSNPYIDYGPQQYRLFVQ